VKQQKTRMRSLLLSFVSGLGFFALSAQTCGGTTPISPLYDCSQYFSDCEEFCREKGGVLLASCDQLTGEKKWPPTCVHSVGSGATLNPPTFQGATN
jgi:hypothetical protein